MKRTLPGYTVLAALFTVTCSCKRASPNKFSQQIDLLESLAPLFMQKSSQGWDIILFTQE